MKSFRGQACKIPTVQYVSYHCSHKTQNNQFSRNLRDNFCHCAAIHKSGLTTAAWRKEGRLPGWFWHRAQLQAPFTKPTRNRWSFALGVWQCAPVMWSTCRVMASLVLPPCSFVFYHLKATQPAPLQLPAIINHGLVFLKSIKDAPRLRWIYIASNGGIQAQTALMFHYWWCSLPLPCIVIMTQTDDIGRLLLYWWLQSVALTYFLNYEHWLISDQSITI